MLSEEQCRRCAERLASAERERRAVEPPSRAHPGMTIEDAYAVQAQWTRARMSGGARLAGYKVGLTSRAMQGAFNASEPIFGRILDDAILESGARVPASRFLRPRIEVELAFVLGEALAGPHADAERVLHATERIVPALELVASRTEMPRSLTDTIADNAAFGAAILGAQGIGPRAADLASIGATLFCRGAPRESGTSAAVLGHPAAAVAWLANALHAAGSGLARGQIVLTGSFTRQIDVGAGDVIRADYGPLGSIDVSFD
jgi:2-oxo-hept-3-ene-1,7-dioate hydratase